MKTILVYTKTAGLDKWIEDCLKPLRHRFCFAGSVDEVANKHAGEVFDLVIFEVESPVTEHIGCVELLKREVVAPVITLVDGNDMEGMERVLQLTEDALLLPFDERELLVRAKVLINHPHAGAEWRQEKSHTAMMVRGFRIWPLGHRLYYHQHEIKLTPKEFDILLLLANHPGQVLTWGQIYKAVWEEEPVVDYRKNVTNHVHSINKTLRAYTQEDVITAERGVGYRCNP